MTGIFYFHGNLLLWSDVYSGLKQELRMNKFVKWIGVGVVSLAAITVTGCNTIQGAGQDIEKAGKTIEDAAK